MVKKIIALTIVTTFTLATIPTVNAQEIMNIKVENDMSQPQELQLLATKGEVKEFENKRIHVKGLPVTETSLEEVILNLEQAQIFDMVTGSEVKKDKIKVGQQVLVYYEPRMSMSLPAQGNAVQVFINVSNEKAASLKMVLSEKISKMEDSVSFLNENGSVIITVNKDTEILDNEGNVIGIDYLNEGDEVLTWFDFMAMSFPGQATATKLVVLNQLRPNIPQIEPPVKAEEPRKGLKMVSLSKEQSPYVNENGTTMIPIRVIAEANGFLVNFNRDTKMITLIRDNVAIEYKNGDDFYIHNGEIKKFDSIDNTQMKNGISFISLDFITSIL